MQIDKGLIKSYLMLSVIVALVGGLFLTIYMFAIILGSIFYIGVDNNVSRDVTNETFIAHNLTPQSLDYTQIVPDTLRLYNSSDTLEEIGTGNFTIGYDNGSILLKTGFADVENGSTCAANYTYVLTTSANLPITSSTNAFLLETQDSFFTNMGYARTAAGFVGGLIAVAIILLIFASFIKTGKGAYEGIAGKRKGARKKWQFWRKREIEF